MSWRKRKISVGEITADDQKTYFLGVIPGEDASHPSFPALPLEVVLYDCEAWYSGKMTKKDVEETVSNLKINPDSFCTYMIEALLEVGNSVSENQYTYQVNKINSTTVKFIWKRLIEPGNIKYQLGSVSLSNENSLSVMEKVLRNIGKQIANQSKIIIQLEAERDRLASDRDAALSTLATCVNEKNELEKNLYSKFCAVLNEKKDRIKSLESSVSNDDDDKRHSGQEAHGSGIKSKQHLVIAALDAKNNSLFEESDDETDDEIPVKKTKK